MDETVYIQQWDATAIYTLGDRVYVDHHLYELQEVVLSNGTRVEAFVRIEDDS